MKIHTGIVWFYMWMNCDIPLPSSIALPCETAGKLWELMNSCVRSIWENQWSFYTHATEKNWKMSITIALKTS